VHDTFLVTEQKIPNGYYEALSTPPPKPIQFIDLAHMKRNADKILLEKPERKAPLEKTRRDGKIILDGS
jgi:hypothetical protein